MLWRESYRPRVFEGQALPDGVGDGILIGAFDLLAQREIGIWLRLIAEAFPALRPDVLLISPTWSAKQRKVAAATFPPSLLGSLRFLEDPEEQWRAAIQPDRPERSFAAIVREGVADLLMVGVPTEEAWDDFRDRLSQRSA